MHVLLEGATVDVGDSAPALAGAADGASASIEVTEGVAAADAPLLSSTGLVEVASVEPSAGAAEGAGAAEPSSATLAGDAEGTEEQPPTVTVTVTVAVAAGGTAMLEG